AQTAATLADLVLAGTIVMAGDAMCDGERWATLRQGAIDLIDGYHATQPDRAGLPVTDVRAALGSIVAAGRVFDALVTAVCALGFVRDRGILRRTTHRPALPAALEAAGSRLRAALAERPFDPPSRGTLVS